MTELNNTLMVFEGLAKSGFIIMLFAIVIVMGIAAHIHDRNNRRK